MESLRAKGKAFLCKNSALYKEIRKSGLFDSSYYEEQNPDVVQSGQNVLVHFITRGVREGRNPSPLFDLQYYQSQVPELIGSKTNPLLHYSEEGARAGINPHPLFHTTFYTQQCAEKIIHTEMNPLCHFLENGDRLSLSPHPLFESRYFSVQLPRGFNRKENLLCSYLALPELWNFDPHPLFDVTYYKMQDLNVATAGLPPLLYYLLYYREGEADPHPFFAGHWYERRYSEYIKKGESPLVHYLLQGQYEGKEPFPYQKKNDHRKEGEKLSKTLKNDVTVEQIDHCADHNKTEGEGVVSIIVWGEHDFTSLVSQLRNFCGACEVIVCTSDPHTMEEVSANESFAVQICRYESSLVKTLQKASHQASGEYLFFLSSELLGNDLGGMQELVSNAVQQQVPVMGCANLQQRRMKQQQLNQQALGTILGRKKISMPGFSPGNRVEASDFSVLTAECMVVQRALFHSLQGFDPLYEECFFDFDFTMKLLTRGIQPVALPFVMSCHNNSPGIDTETTGCNIDRMLLVDRWQVEVIEHFSVTRDTVDLTGYMDKRREELFQLHQDEKKTDEYIIGSLS